MEFLKPVLGEGYATFEAAVKAWNEKPENKDKQVKIADIGSGEYVSKSKYDALEAAKNSVDNQLQTATNSLKKFEGIDPEKLSGEVTKLKGELETQRKAAEGIQKEYALKDKLRDAGVLDADYVIYKQGGVDKFTFDKDGKPIGVEDVLKPIKEASPHLFKAAPRTEYNPAGGGNPPSKNPFAQDSFNLTEQGRLLRENPEQARQLAAAAGVTI